MKFLVSLIIALSIFVFYKVEVFAQPNNRLGVHILDPNEIEKAAKFVNSENKLWGYVVVPIRIDDRDFPKWKLFFEKTKALKVIPMIRLAMHADDKGGWAIPTDDEIYYSAKFLDQMPWPIKSRYIIVFNEPNHAPEWGGQLNPSGYAQRLNFAIDVFKSLNSDYFMLNAALDWAAPNGSQTMQARDYWNGILNSIPELALKIDGLNSHAYPNPGFQSPPSNSPKSGIGTYKSELEILSKYGRQDIPIFITETNWTDQKVSESTRINYWQTAWNEIWIEPNIKNITVWLLEAHDGPFEQFSLYKNQQPSDLYQAITLLERESGQPQLNLDIMPSPSQAPKEAGESGKSEDWWNLNIFGNLFSWIGRLFSKKDDSPKAVFSNGSILKLEIARTPSEIQTGLMHRTSLDLNTGMLFLLNQTGISSFWMKNTLINLDMIWIKDSEIVDIHHNVPVETDPTNPRNFYKPQRAANKVIEVNGGWSNKNSIKIGDKVNFKGKI